MKVKCIDNNGVNLKLGEIYDALILGDGTFLVQGNCNGLYNAIRFVEVKEKEKPLITDAPVAITNQLSIHRYNDSIIFVSPSNPKKNQIKVIVNSRAVIVYIDDKFKGVAKCLPDDIFNSDKGFKIAFKKAQIKMLNAELKELCK